MECIGKAPGREMVTAMADMVCVMNLARSLKSLELAETYFSSAIMDEECCGSPDEKETAVKSFWEHMSQCREDIKSWIGQNAYFAIADSAPVEMAGYESEN